VGTLLTMSDKSHDKKPVSGGDVDAPRLRTLLWGDIRRGAAAATVAGIGLAVVEYFATLLAAPPPVRFVTALRFVLLDVTLVALFLAIFVPVLGGIAALARVLLHIRSPDRALAWRGLLAPTRWKVQKPSAGPAWIWALLLTLPAFLGASTALTLRLWPIFHAKALAALLLAVIQLMLFAGLGVVTVLIMYGARWAGRSLHHPLGRANPLGQVPAALATLGVLLVPVTLLVLRALPTLKMVINWRLIFAALVIWAGLVAAKVWLAWRGSLWPRQRRRRRIALGVAGISALILIPLTLVRVGADPETKLLVVTSSAPLNLVIDGVRKANDFDGDGFGSLLGENDCGPFDARVHPGARDIPDNGIDENCDGRDFSLARMPQYRRGMRMALPAAFRRDWNVLLLTIDNVRYDHTGFGGYGKKRGRDTTPFLDRLVKKSVSFTFANAPAAGTVASVPAILTSKFFHSGIALSGERRGKPPKLLGRNVMIAEVMKRGGYTTGAIVTHEYFNDWGLEQGFDTYDNEIGRVRAPYKTTSPELTQKAISWIARHSRKKWFLWAHYLDPHGRYVAHPGHKSWGKTEEDLYDGEIRFTDEWVEKLLQELWRMPGGNRTIVIITSDHGDGFREHGKINHGWGLHRELLHVPLIVHVPDVPPRRVDGAVSPIDVLPTLADLCSIDVSDLSFEGESLVPQLFYGRDAHHRVVFSETNYPHPQRSATTSRHKLIYNLKANLYQLFDLKTDPWEHRNIYQRDRATAAKMRRYLSDWMERVFYSKDIHTNQAAALRKWHRLPSSPKPRNKASLVFDNGAMEIIGYDVNRLKRGGDLEITLYFHVRRQPRDRYSFRLSVWPDPSESGSRRLGRTAHSPTLPTVNGIYPSTRWRAGEYIRDRLKVRLDRRWRGDRVQVGIEVFGQRKRRHSFQGASRSGRPTVGLLGSLSLKSVGAPSSRRSAKSAKGNKDSRGGCGCAAPGTGGGLWLLMLIGFFSWRRRRWR
jgi:MYXO-CTERM domain-containing protein